MTVAGALKGPEKGSLSASKSARDVGSLCPGLQRDPL